MDAGSTPKGMLIYSGRAVLRWSNFRNSFGYFFASPYLALSMTVLPFFPRPRFQFHRVVFITRCALRYDRSNFDSLSGHWDYCYESREIHRDFFFFSSRKRQQDSAYYLKIIKQSSKDPRDLIEDCLPSTNLHDSKRPTNFRSNKIYEVNFFFSKSRKKIRRHRLNFCSKTFR